MYIIIYKFDFLVRKNYKRKHYVYRFFIVELGLKTTSTDCSQTLRNLIV